MLLTLAALRIVTNDGCCRADDLTLDEGFVHSLPAHEQLLVRDFVVKREILRRVYRNMSLDVTITDEFARPPGTEMKKIKDKSASFATLDNQWYRLDGIYQKTPGVALLGPEEGFVFGKNATLNSWFLVNRFPASSRLVMEYMSPYRIDSHPTSSGKFFDLVYGKLAKEEHIELQSLVEAGEGKSKTVTANLLSRRQLNDKGLEVTFVRVVFLPNLSWALREWFEASAETNGGEYYVVIRRNMEYDGEKDGVPLLKKSIEESAVSRFQGSHEFCETSYCGGPLLIARRSTALVSNFDPTPPPLAKFDHRPFLKSAGGLGVVLNQSWTGTILLINGVVLFLFGLWVMRSRRSQQKKVSEPGLSEGP